MLILHSHANRIQINPCTIPSRELEQQHEMFGVMCLPELMLAGSDYSVWTSGRVINNPTICQTSQINTALIKESPGGSMRCQDRAHGLLGLGEQTFR